MSSDIRLDLSDPDFYRDPYPTYRWLRENAPVCWYEPMGGWLVSKATDVIFCSRDSQFKKNFHTLGLESLPVAERPKFESLVNQWGMTILFKDGDEHTRLRRAMAKAFTPKILESMRTRVEAIVDNLLDSFAEKNVIEFTSEFAMPLPAQVTAQMLGLFPNDYRQLFEWVECALKIVLPTTLEIALQSQYSYQQVEAIFREAIEECRASPFKYELLTELLSAEKEGLLTEEEIIPNCILLLVGGIATTLMFFGTALLALLQHPRQLQMLKENPNLTPNAVEELLRYASTTVTVRRVEEDLELGTQQLRAGDFVYLLLSSANHDPDYFTNPDDLDITRETAKKHFAFGVSGQPHFCIGANLARLEITIALNKLFQRFPDLRLAIEPENIKWVPDFAFRRPESLPIFLR